MNRWWCIQEEPYFWVEVTIRDDLGANLKAPTKDVGGRDYWSYSILKEMKIGDTVLHYHQKNKGIVGISQVSETWKYQDIKWTPSKKKFESTKGPRPGFLVGIKNFKKIKPIYLKDIQKKNKEIETLSNSLKSRFGSSYFPFYIRKSRPYLSVNEGYGFIVNQDFVDLFPQLSKFIGNKFQIKQNIETNKKPGKQKNKPLKISSQKRECVELYAVKKAEKDFISKGYEVEQMPRRNFPYDLKAKKNEEELYIEVKGKEGPAESVDVSRNEVIHCKENYGKSVLVVVKNVKTKLTQKGLWNASGGKIKIIKPWEINDDHLIVNTYKYKVPK